MISNLLLNIKTDSEFLMLLSKLRQSFKVEEKEILETICLTVVGWYMVVLCSR